MAALKNFATPEVLSWTAYTQQPEVAPCGDVRLESPTGIAPPDFPVSPSASEETDVLEHYQAF